MELFLERQGVAYSDVLRAAHVSPDTLQSDHSEVPLDKIVAVLDAAALATSSPCLGAQWAEAFNPGETGAYGYLLRNAASVRDALNVIVRYLSLVIHPVAIAVKNDGAITTLTWRLVPRIQSRATQYLLFATGATVARLRTAAGGCWDPVHVELACPELPCKALLHRVLGPSISFAAKETRLFIATNTLDHRNASADPRLFSLLQDLGERMLRERCTEQGYPHVIKKIISHRLGHGEVTLETVAFEDGTSPRTLQARLATEGTSFEDLLQTTRRQMAEDYLRDTDLPLSEIALLLGFSELSAFSRACHRWFEEPPSLRRRHLRQARQDLTGGSALAAPKA
jgi:AraC-like DNA-binding protein